MSQKKPKRRCKYYKKQTDCKRLKQPIPKEKSNKNSTKKQKDTDLLNIEQEMSDAFGHKVEIEAKNKKNGKVVISYSTSDELENIIAKLTD